MAAHTTAPLDLSIRVDTPEGIGLPLTPAGPLARTPAFLIDLLLRLLLAAFTLHLATLGDLGVGLSLLLIFLITWWYMVLFEVLWLGYTPGKRLLGLRVVQLDGTPPDWGSSLLRNLLRLIDMLPFGYGCGILSSLASPRFQRLGDMVAGTLVIHDSSNARRLSITAPDTANGRLPQQPLSGEEQSALLALAERQGSLSSARRSELTAILQPLLGCSESDCDREVSRLAAGLRGQS